MTYKHELASYFSTMYLIWLLQTCTPCSKTLQLNKKQLIAEVRHSLINPISPTGFLPAAHWSVLLNHDVASNVTQEKQSQCDRIQTFIDVTPSRLQSVLVLVPLRATKHKSQSGFVTLRK